MLRATSFILFLTASVTAFGQSAVYKTTDKDGNVVFTDAPPANSTQSEKVDIQRVNTTPAPKISEDPEPADVAPIAPDPKIVQQVVTIATPRNGETIPMGPGNFSVNVKVKPQLIAGQTLQLFMDGVPYSDPQRNATWALMHVFRGEHELTVGIMNDNGEIISMSEPVTVFVLRPSVR